MSCRAVILDLWETLIRAVATSERGQPSARAASGGISEADFVRGWSGTREAATRGELRCMRHRVQEALRQAGAADPDPQLVDELTGLMHVRWRPYLFPEVRSVLAELGARGYRLGLISNIAYDEYTVPDVYDLRSFLQAAVLSCEVGMAKPEPGIYRLAAARLGVAPEECVFVDDTPSYVEGARRVGMTGVRIDRPRPGKEKSSGPGYDLRIEGLGELLDWLAARAGRES